MVRGHGQRSIQGVGKFFFRGLVQPVSASAFRGFRAAVLDARVDSRTTHPCVRLKPLTRNVFQETATAPLPLACPFVGGPCMTKKSEE